MDMNWSSTLDSNNYSVIVKAGVNTSHVSAVNLKALVSRQREGRQVCIYSAEGEELSVVICVSYGI